MHSVQISRYVHVSHVLIPVYHEKVSKQFFGVCKANSWVIVLSASSLPSIRGKENYVLVLYPKKRGASFFLICDYTRAECQDT